MKILLTSLNAKYIHSNLALRYLRGVCPDHEVTIQEYTINDRLDVIAGEIYKSGAGMVGFSCYIWNIHATLELTDILHQASPGATIVLGGPEVSYDPGEYIDKYPSVDFVVYGEGEETFRELASHLKARSGQNSTLKTLSDIKGLAYRSEDGRAIVNPPRELIQDLSGISSPYASLEGLEHKIAYVESTRGCPFNCQYCLSSTFQGVRYFPLERTKEELKTLIAAGIKQIKFVDRTFNCSKTHALAIMTFLAGWNPAANFHFEISADLLDQEMLEFLKGVPPGLFQFEVGVQSTNQETLGLIQRRTNLPRLAANVRAIAANGNIEQFLDLIAGLPGEDYQSFVASFNNVYSWRPDKLQLGFLKLLKGSGMRERAGEWGYKFTASPPYKVLANKWLSYQELLQLQVIEDLVDKYFNSGRFGKSLEFLIQETGQGPFACFEAMAEFWQEKGYHRQAHNAKALYDLLVEFYQSHFFQPSPAFTQLLKFDYLLWHKPAQVAAWFPTVDFPGFKERADSFLRTGLPQLLPQLAQVSRREINKYFHLEPFARVIVPYLETDFIPETGEPVCLLFYYPGPLIGGKRPGFIPVAI